MEEWFPIKEINELTHNAYTEYRKSRLRFQYYKTSTSYDNSIYLSENKSLLYP